MGKTLLELIGQNKNNEDKEKILFPTSEGKKEYDTQYSLNSFFTQYVVAPIENNFYGIDPLEVGKIYLEDKFDLNLHKPLSFELTDMSQKHISVIDMPSISDVSEGFYREIVKCNFFVNPVYEYIGFEPCTPFTEQEKNYVEYVRKLQNNGNIFDVLSIFTGNKTTDTPIGLIGRDSLINHFNRNINDNVLQIASNFVETSPSRFLQTNNLLRLNYDISVPKTSIGKLSLLLEKLSGAYVPVSFLPEDAFNIENSSEISKKQQLDALLEYTGLGQKKELERLLNKNIYRPQIVSKNINVKDNLYVNNNNTYEFNSEYSNEEILQQIKDKNGNQTTLYSDENLYHNPLYNITQQRKNIFVGDLFSNSEDFQSLYDESPDDSYWNPNTENKFNPKSLLFKTKQIINNNSQVNGSFLNNSANEFNLMDDGGAITISKGDAVTAFADWPKDQDNLDYVVKKGDFFRTWNKNRKYNKLNRAIYHRGLDSGDKRSVLNDNGIVNIAPTYRSTNDSHIKKYMFSLENLAWADNLADLPECEVGVGDLITGHKGRVMWFPPYDLAFNENTNMDWNSHNFIGRAEPVFSFNSSLRTGSINFTMIVDHPEIVNKLRGTKTEFWERYFKGDKSIEQNAKSLLKQKLSPREIEEIERIKKNNKKVPKITNEKVLTTPQKQEQIVNKNVNSENNRVLFISSYFPNNVSNITTLSGSDINNKGYQSIYQSTNLDYTYYKGVKRDKDYEKKTGKKSYANKTNYNLNDNFLSEEYVKSQFDTMFTKMKNLNASEVKVVFGGYATQAVPLDTSNYTLSLERAKALQQWFNKKLTEYKKNVNLGDTKIDTSSIVEYSDSLSVNTLLEIDSKDSVAFRRADVYIEYIINNDIKKEENIANLNDVAANENLNQDANLISDEPISLDNLTPDILEKLFGISECDMFDYLETYDQRSYKTISEQIKYFHPAFHSMTPQGFNSRLNFLQQCCRQGQSIGVDGIDNLTNFAFGRPPVLILKIGDFFHTKIILNSLSIDYENPKWDFNPQGFVAPMICKVSLSVTFLGGQSITSPINRLQNALSFNYYSSIEMFDPRADTVKMSNINGKDEVSIVDGLKLSQVISPSTITDKSTKSLSDVDSLYGKPIVTQKSNPTITPETNNNTGFVEDIITLKKYLNLQLTETEKTQ